MLISDLTAACEKAAAILRAGGLVAFPTETVYGLGADASRPQAVARVYAVKGRPPSHPVIVHVSAHEQLFLWAREVPREAQALVERFWPGPLTLVLKRTSGVGDYLTGGQDTIALRLPAHPLARALLAEFARGNEASERAGLAAPSANRYGRVSPTTAEHVRRELGAQIDFVLDGGPCEVGIESTILDLSRGRPVLLRPGGVGAEAIAEVLGVLPQPADAAAPRAPGTLPTHYAPRQPLRLVGAQDFERALAEEAHERLAVLALRPQPARTRTLAWITARADPRHYARELYARLRALEESGCERILVEAPPASLEWQAVNDRLARAAGPRR